MSSDNVICLRQGFLCTCDQCRIWIDRWDRELEGFAVIDSMMRKGDSLFQIYERLRAGYPDILRLHHKTIEEQYIEYKQSSLVPKKVVDSNS